MCFLWLWRGFAAIPVTWNHCPPRSLQAALPACLRNRPEGERRGGGREGPGRGREGQGGAAGLCVGGPRMPPEGYAWGCTTCSSLSSSQALSPPGDHVGPCRPAPSVVGVPHPVCSSSRSPPSRNSHSSLPTQTRLQTAVLRQSCPVAARPGFHFFLLPPRPHGHRWGGGTSAR